MSVLRRRRSCMRTLRSNSTVAVMCNTAVPCCPASDEPPGLAVAPRGSSGGGGANPQVIAAGPPTHRPPTNAPTTSTSSRSQAARHTCGRQGSMEASGSDPSPGAQPAQIRRDRAPTSLAPGGWPAAPPVRGPPPPAACPRRRCTPAHQAADAAEALQERRERGRGGQAGWEGEGGGPPSHAPTALQPAPTHVDAELQDHCGGWM